VLIFERIHKDFESQKRSYKQLDLSFEIFQKFERKNFNLFGQDSFFERSFSKKKFFAREKKTWHEISHVDGRNFIKMISCRKQENSFLDKKSLQK